MRSTTFLSSRTFPDQEQAIASLALDPFDTPFKMEEPTANAVTMPAVRRPPLLPTDLQQRLVDTEVDLLIAALEKARFNQRLAADLLGLSYHQFRGKLKKFAIRSKP